MVTVIEFNATLLTRFAKVLAVTLDPSGSHHQTGRSLGVAQDTNTVLSKERESDTPTAKAAEVKCRARSEHHRVLPHAGYDPRSFV